MLAKAEERGCYDALIEVDMTTFLEQTSERFDLVFVADALVYLGDLEDFFAAAAYVTTSGGILAFNVETTAPRELGPASIGPLRPLRRGAARERRAVVHAEVEPARVPAGGSQPAGRWRARLARAPRALKRQIHIPRSRRANECGQLRRLPMSRVGPVPLRPKQRHQRQIAPSPVRSEIGLAQHAVAGEARFS